VALASNGLFSQRLFSILLRNKAAFRLLQWAKSRLGKNDDGDICKAIDFRMYPPDIYFFPIAYAANLR